MTENSIPDVTEGRLAVAAAEERPARGHVDATTREAKSPLEELQESIWRRIRNSRHKRMWTALAVALSFSVWMLLHVDAIEEIGKLFITPPTYASDDEITCLNEWVLKIASENTEEGAIRRQQEFLGYYRDFGHVNAGGQPIWSKVVHVVRDIAVGGKWLVVIDMYPGASSRQCMLEGQAEMLGVLDGKPDDLRPGNKRDWEDTIGRMLRPAEPLCYDLETFEHVNGRIENTGKDIEQQRSLGSCKGKLTRSTEDCTIG